MRDAARQKFSDLGLKYADIRMWDLNELVKMLKLELARYLVNGGEHAMTMDMSVAKIRKNDIRVDKHGDFLDAQIQINGSYFKRREGITFCQGGFIGFGNEFSDCNVKPIIHAFIKWCDYMYSKGRVEA